MLVRVGEEAPTSPTWMVGIFGTWDYVWRPNVSIPLTRVTPKLCRGCPVPDLLWIVAVVADFPCTHGRPGDQV